MMGATMKAKIERGSGFRGVLNYCLDEGPNATGDKHSEIIGGTVTGTTAKEIAREFAVTRRLRPDIKRPVWHSSLSCPPGERPTSERWNQLAKAYLKKMGFPEDTVWVATRHGDTEHDHIHIIASRISLSGKVWHGQHEAFKAIQATQELEKEFGLTLTPGLGDAKDEARTPRVKLTTQELSKAERTGVQPARLVIFDAITRRLKAGKQTLTEFIKRLRDDDVHVVPKVASQTGKLQGLSFEYDGLVFAGGKLATGHSYTLGNLKKKGVSYEPSRDDEAVADAVRAARERAASRKDADRDHSGAGAGESPDAGFAPGSGEGAGSGDEAVRVPRPVAESPARHPGHHEQRYGPEERAGDAEDNGSRERPADGHEGPAVKPKHSGQGGGNDKATRQDQGGNDMETTTDDVRHRPSVQRPNGGGGWNARFKKASAAKRRASQSDAAAEARRSLEAAAIDANKLDPGPILEAAGYVVKRQGKHMSVCHPAGDEVYRITLMPDGRYISCDHYANGIGDNIALLRDLEPGLTFPDAVYRLTGGQSLKDAVAHAEPPPIAPPRLPRPSAADIEAGRKYLQGRGIDAQTLAEAEKAGFLRYAPGAVVYVGQDKEGKVKAATRRAINPTDPVQKRDFKGTNKYFPAVLPGNPERVFIVEGGADALALHSMAHRAGQEPPTVIVSSGSNVLSFLRNQETQALLKRAQEVIITTEVEKDADTQAKVEKARQKQIDAVAQIIGKQPEIQAPAHGAKDISEQNQLETERAKADNQKVVEAVQTTPPPAAPPMPPASRYSNFSRPKG